MENPVCNEEAVLLRELRQGSTDAYITLYNQYSPSLYTYILHFINVPEFAEDALQEVFIKIWEIRERINPELSFSGYLYRITRNHVFKLLKKITADKALRLQVIRDLWLKTDLFAWSGPRYMRQDGSDGKLSGAFDLNAGLEFKITRNINLWTQFNNIFNKEYQRWNQYRVYGFNFVGGIIFSFDQKP